MLKNTPHENKSHPKHIGQRTKKGRQGTTQNNELRQRRHTDREIESRMKGIQE